MKFFLKVTNTERKFKVDVHIDDGQPIFSCGWQGGEFKYKGKQYAVYGPYHGLDGDMFRVYELVPASEAV